MRIETRDSIAAAVAGRVRVAGHRAVRPWRGPDARAAERRLSVQLIPLDALPPRLANEWPALAVVASEPCAFAEHWFMLPSLAQFASDPAIQIAVARDGAGELAGVMPLAIKTRYGRIPVRNVQNWMHHNCFLGTPLVRRGDEQRFWRALLERLDASPWSRGLLHISGLVAGGPVLAGLHAAARALGRPCDTVHRLSRALLVAGLGPEAYYEGTVRKKKRKEIARLASRLAEQGRVDYATLERGDDLSRWIDDFLALERAGWKGRAGSALACDEAADRFFRDVLTGAFAAGQLDFHRLDLDGAPIAMLVNFVSPPGAFSFKIAFDESYARFSPGVLIQRYNLRILERGNVQWMDSCAAEDHPMINSLWSGRREIVRVSVPLGGRWRGWLFRACRMIEDGAAWLRSRKEPRDAR